VEAFAKGTPVVASDAGALAELVSDGLTGFHFRPGDPADLVRAVRSAFAGDSAAAAMRVQARKEYEARYTGTANCELLTEIYSRAIAARTAHR
jgi:glycosyltransferase involved in cell wall biosynthesis